MRAKPKVETVEEYLARGGTIKKIAAGVSEAKVTTRKSAAGEPAVVLTLDEAEMYYGEGKKPAAKKKAKVKPSLDLSSLPESLRVKFLARIKDGDYGQENED